MSGSSDSNDELTFESETTISSALSKSVSFFESNKISEPVLSSCHLLSFALNLSWDYGFSELLQLHQLVNSRHPLLDRVLTPEELASYQSMCHRRATHEPVQYIIGKWDFYDFSIQCRSPILCPRPETEELVDIVSEDIRRLLKTRKTVRVLDVGCGTGVIGIALAKRFPTNVEIVAIDIAKEAVRLTLENALSVLGGTTTDDFMRENDPRYSVMLSSADNFTNDRIDCQFEFDVAVSNPPYIPAEDMGSLEKDVVHYESHGALCGGVDGMDVIRDIVGRLPHWTRDSAASEEKDQREETPIVWMETDTSHPSLIEEWLKHPEDESCSIRFLETRQDLCGRDRFVKLAVLPTP